MQRMNVDRAAGHVLPGQRNRKENGRQRLLRRRSRSGLFPRPPKSLRCPGQARCTPEQRGACAVERSGWGEGRARAHAPLTRTDTCTRPCARTQRHTWARTHARTHPAVAQKHTHTDARAHLHPAVPGSLPVTARQFASSAVGGEAGMGRGVPGLSSCCCRPSRRAQSPRPHCRQSQLLTCGLVPLGQPAPGPGAVVLVWCGAGTAPRGSTDRHREQMAGRRLGAASGPFTVLSDSF